LAKEQNKQKGDIGEQIATDYLVKKGYKILKRNFRCKFGEIDIVAKKGKTITFVEVKTKTSNELGSPEEMVDDHKMEKIGGMIEYFLSLIKTKPEPDVQVDVIAVEINAGGELLELRHLENFG